MGPRLSTPFSTLFSKSLLSERPGFDPRRGQTLKACNFAALWSGKTYSTSFERSKLYLLGQMEKKRFGAFLKHFSLAQNTLKSYHKWPKSRFNLQGTVSHLKILDQLNLAYLIQSAAVLLGVLLVGQSTLKSLHKMHLEWLYPIVSMKFL